MRLVPIVGVARLDLQRAEHRKRVEIPITPTVVSIGPTIQVQWEAA
jgi:hypothetical protein